MDDGQKKFIPQLAIDTEYLKGFHRIGDFFIKTSTPFS
jgi:hypothetical protein